MPRVFKAVQDLGSYGLRYLLTLFFRHRFVIENIRILIVVGERVELDQLVLGDNVFQDTPWHLRKQPSIRTTFSAAFIQRAMAESGTVINSPWHPRP